MDERTLEAVAHEIEKNLARLTIEKDASYALESEEFKKKFAERLIIASSNIKILESALLPRLQSAITDDTSDYDTKANFTQSIRDIHNIRKTYE
jgi:hypothetical protein